MNILVFMELRDGALKKASLEALGLATRLKDSKVALLLAGDGADVHAKELSGYGASKIYVSKSLKGYNVLEYTDVLEKAVDEFGAQLVLGMATPMGRDLLARFGARKKAGVLSDIVEVVENGAEILGGIKPVYSGKVMAEMRYSGASALKVMSLRPNSFPAATPKGSAAEVVSVEPRQAAKGLKLKEVRRAAGTKVDLTEATRIISGGRALGSKEKFKIFDECANLLGASIGASRAAVDSGYASHDMQVGQTGKTVNPELYIACGISGSIQHMAGMRSSKVIVAVNTDKDAPIFGIASYGIEGDLFEVVPLLTQRLKEVLT